MAARLNKLIGEAIFQDIIGCFPILAQRQQIKLWEARWVGKPIAKRVEWGTVFHQWTIFKKFWIGQSRGSNRSRLSAFVQISALFQIYITDMSRHLHHLTNCPFEVKKGGLKGLFLYWEVILLIFFVFVIAKRYFFIAGKGLCYTPGHIKRNIELFLEDSVFGLVWPDKR